MKASKRILSLVLAIAMIATCGLTTVFAEVLPEARNSGGSISSGEEPDTDPPTDNTYTITVNAGEGGSAVASFATAKEGATVTVTATPNNGYEVDAVTSNDATLTGGGNTRTFTMPAKAVAVEVTFKAVAVVPEKYNITKATATNGSFTVKVDGSDATAAAKGAIVTVNATANSGYEVNTFSVTDADGGNVSPLTGTGSTRTFTMPAKAVTVTVTFKAVTVESGEYLINKTLAINGSFVTNVKGVEASKAKKDEIVLIETTPDTDYAVDKISVTGKDNSAIGVLDSGVASFVMPEQDVTVKVTFKTTVEAPVEHNITKETATNGSFTVKVNGALATKAAKDKTVAIATTPNTGYVVNTVVVTGADNKPVTVTGAGSERTFVMPDQAVKVAVTFKTAPAEALFKIALYNTENATYTIKADGKDISAIGRTAKAGAKITATFAAKDGYTLKKVESDAPGWTGKDGSYSFTMPAKDVGISVFTEKKPVIEIDPDQDVNGDVPPNTTMGGKPVDHVSAAPADEAEVAEIVEQTAKQLDNAGGLKKDKNAPQFGAIDIFPVDKDGNLLTGILSKPITVKITITSKGFVPKKNNMRIMHKHGIDDVEVIQLSGVKPLGNDRYELSFPMSKFSVVMPVAVETTSTPGGGTSSGSTSSSGGSSGGGSSLFREFDGERLYLVGGEIVPSSVVEEMAGRDKTFTVVYNGKTYTFNGKNIAKPGKNIMYYTPEEFMKLIGGKVISTTTNDVSNPDTGANDFVGLALALAVVSLAGVATCSFSKKK